jgi:hypothetical protein
MADAAALDAHSNDELVREKLVRALMHAPYQPQTWLTLARFAGRFKWERYDRTALLEMVYHTGLDNIDLVPQRTKLVLGLDAYHLDAELSEMVTLDVNFVMRARPELWPGLVEAYRSASPEGRAVVEHSAVWSDPSFRLKVRKE